MTPTELLDGFMAIAERGDEAAAEQFLRDHLQEFPEETRDQIISAYVKDAIRSEAAEIEARGEAERDAIAADDDIKAAHKEVQNQAQIAALKEQLGTK